MKLTKSIPLYGTDEFADELMDELNSNADEMPTEAACEHGGYPEYVDVYAADGIHEDEHYVYATVSIAVTEEVNTTCADVSVSFQHDMTCNLTIDKSDFSVEFEVVETEREPEF
jgi:hypothetical protein